MTDADGETSLRELQLTIVEPVAPSPSPSPAPSPVPQPPTIVTTSLPASTSGTSYSQQLVGSGGQGPYSWTVESGGLPPGLTLASNGTLTGVPIKPGSYTFTVEIRDAHGLTAVQTYTVAISASSAPPPPQFTSGAAFHIQGGGTTGSGCEIGRGDSRGAPWPLVLLLLVLGRARRARTARQEVL